MRCVTPRSLGMLVVAVACPISAVGAQIPTARFASGATITHSVRIRPGVYLAPTADRAVLTIRGTDITVDLTGVTLVGDTDRTHPDRFAGTAVRIEGGRNITVRGLHARGYRVGIIARHVTHLTLFGNDLSYNWRPRLYSGIEKESLIDWLDYHNNEHDEWLRYGAGIYLADVTGAEIRGNTVRNGMDGLMVVRTTEARIWNNDLSFNSGVGMGLYRSSHNRIMHNRIDWNVRGYSDGFYNRGQDSGGLLMYEQSTHNVIAYNSVTHSGDGLFIWAGQTTMDSGKGGVNDNLIYGNDFSFAPTNGMEATFSRNVFVANRVDGSWHGLWGGYSYQSIVLGNHFAHNGEGISIEHGQENRIAGNTFDGDTIAVHLWWNTIAPSDWGYPRFRDTQSRDYTVLGNTFRDNRVAVWLVNTERATIRGNRFIDVDTMYRVSGDTSGTVLSASVERAAPVPIPPQYRVEPLVGGIDALGSPMIRRDRSSIIVDQWGPYDWRSPRLWPVGGGRDDGSSVRLRVLGPPGKWRILSRHGVASVSREGGVIGDTIAVFAAQRDCGLILEYRGGAVTTEFGEQIGAGHPVRFSWSRFAPIADWHVRFVRWDSARVPLNDSTGVNRALRSGSAVATMDTNRLDLTWYGPPRRENPQADVLTEATTTLHLDPGRYRVRTIADDAIRVYVNGRLVIDDWHPGESHLKVSVFTATGSDSVRVVHLQRDGWYELRLDIEPERP